MIKLILLSLVVSSSAFAAESDVAAQPDGEGAVEMFQRLDANGDQAVTKEELHAHYNVLHTQMDADQDQKVHRDEVEADKGERFDEVDTDGDGYVSYDEGFAIEEARFADADTDGDGNVTWAEFQVHYEAKH